jgi:hypothetical protein
MVLFQDQHQHTLFSNPLLPFFAILNPISACVRASLALPGLEVSVADLEMVSDLS